MNLLERLGKAVQQGEGLAISWRLVGNCGVFVGTTSLMAVRKDD